MNKLRRPTRPACINSRIIKLYAHAYHNPNNKTFQTINTFKIKWNIEKEMFQWLIHRAIVASRTSLLTCRINNANTEDASQNSNP